MTPSASGSSTSGEPSLHQGYYNYAASFSPGPQQQQQQQQQHAFAQQQPQLGNSPGGSGSKLNYFSPSSPAPHYVSREKGK